MTVISTCTTKAYNLISFFRSNQTGLFSKPEKTSFKGEYIFEPSQIDRVLIENKDEIDYLKKKLLIGI